MNLLCLHVFSHFSRGKLTLCIHQGSLEKQMGGGMGVGVCTDWLGDFKEELAGMIT